MANSCRLLITLLLTVAAAQLEWSNWSEWTSSFGACYRAYTRSRQCVSPSTTNTGSTNAPGVVAAGSNCSVAGEWELDYRNRTESSCTDSGNTESETSTGLVVLGLVSAVALLLMLCGLVFGVMCLRLWIKRTTYNVRQARLLHEQVDNIPAYHNILLSPHRSNDDTNNTPSSVSDTTAAPVERTLAGGQEDTSHDDNTPLLECPAVSLPSQSLQLQQCEQSATNNNNGSNNGKLSLMQHDLDEGMSTNHNIDRISLGVNGLPINDGSPINENPPINDGSPINDVGPLNSSRSSSPLPNYLSDNLSINDDQPSQSIDADQPNDYPPLNNASSNVSTTYF